MKKMRPHKKGVGHGENVQRPESIVEKLPFLTPL